MSYLARSRPLRRLNVCIMFTHWRLTRTIFGDVFKLTFSNLSLCSCARSCLDGYRISSLCPLGMNENIFSAAATKPSILQLFSRFALRLVVALLIQVVRQRRWLVCTPHSHGGDRSSIIRRRAARPNQYQWRRWCRQATSTTTTTTTTESCSWLCGCCFLVRHLLSKPTRHLIQANSVDSGSVFVFLHALSSSFSFIIGWNVEKQVGVGWIERRRMWWRRKKLVIWTLLSGQQESCEICDTCEIELDNNFKYWWSSNQKHIS